MSWLLLCLKLLFLFFIGIITGISLEEENKSKISAEIYQMQKTKLGLESFFEANKNFEIQNQQDNSKYVIRHAAESISRKLQERINILKELKNSILSNQADFEELENFKSWSLCCETNKNTKYTKSSSYSKNFFEKVSIFKEIGLKV